MNENESKRKKGKGKGIFIVIALAVLALLGYFVLTARSEAETEKLLTFESAPERVEFLNRNGLIVRPDPERKLITIPSEFNAAYEKYNEIQKSQGFDLLPYAGKEVTLYSYSVLNYPDHPENVTANLLFDGKLLIGADITYNDSENGFTVKLIPDTIQEQLKKTTADSETSAAAETSTAESNETSAAETSISETTVPETTTSVSTTDSETKRSTVVVTTDKQSSARSTTAETTVPVSE